MSQKILKDFIRESAMSSSNVVSAGFVIVRRFSDGIRFLGLRRFSNFDLPKGHVEPGENVLDAAKREAHEESCITDLKMEWGDQHISIDTPKKKIILFLASTEQDAEIIPNPETGRYEHHGAKWISFSDAKPEEMGKLFPAIKWAERLISSS